jgi:hypothetical protein
MIKYFSLKAILMLLIAVTFLTVSAEAQLQYFFCIKMTTNPNQWVGNQLMVEVSSYNTGQILFDFYNLGPISSVITQIYFDDLVGALSYGGILEYSQPGVDFEPANNVGNPPAFTFPDPDFLADFEFDAQPPPSQKGINAPSEHLGIYFTGSFDDVDDYLANGNLRMALHVQAISPTGGSDTYMNCTEPGTEPIPEPGTFLLLGTGLLGIAAVRYRRSKN